MRQSNTEREKMEKQKTRKYTEEFKRQAVQLAAELGNVIKASRQLGIPEATIYAWRTKLRHERMLAPGIGPAKESPEEELKRLRRECAELKKVNHILKSATAIFTRDHLS